MMLLLSTGPILNVEAERGEYTPAMTHQV